MSEFACTECHEEMAALFPIPENEWLCETCLLRHKEQELTRANKRIGELEKYTIHYKKCDLAHIEGFYPGRGWHVCLHRSGGGYFEKHT